MKIPLSWISLYSPLSNLLQKYAIKDLAHEYSIHTAEIDGIEDHFLDRVVVGRVLSCEKHPESKKLSIVKLALGEHGEETILTGAQNISEATYVPVALVGAVLPEDFTIGERMMAGMMSRGMICGADEIGMSTEESTGIMILEQDWDTDLLESHLGKSFFDLTLPFPGSDGKVYNFPLRDTTFEIDNKFITNRPDLFSVVGNAREFHAVFATEFSPYTGEESKSLVSDTKPLTTGIETDRVLSYHLMKMDNITVGKSPFGLSLMMERAGLGPKMDIVDITNCMMTELGQPMHAFDADKIHGDIRVRLAKNGEKLLALNGVEYTLTSEDVVIADENGPVALAGVIGGMESAVSENTKNIIWESACFDAKSVRLTAQRHGVRTDASTRYEKSLDPLLAGTTWKRVIEYMEFLEKGYTITGSSSYVDEKSIHHIEVVVSKIQIEKKIGIMIQTEDIERILSSLGFAYTKNSDVYTITVPSWRATKDVSIPEDIIEEIGRVYGYVHVPYIPLSSAFSIGKKNHEINLRNLSNIHFSERGWSEVYNYGFTSESLDERLGYTDMVDSIQIQNAFNVEYTHMTRSLAVRLLQNIADNQKYSEDLAFFEISKVYEKSTDHVPRMQKLLEQIEKKPYVEKKILAGVCIGQSVESLRGTLEHYMRKTLGYIPPVHQGKTHLPFLHPGASGYYSLDDLHVISFGKIHPATASAYDISPETLYFEVNYEILLELMTDKEEVFHEISRYQTIERELNFILPEHTPTGDIAKQIDALHPWIQGVTVDSVFMDTEKVGTGKKSVNFAFTLSNTEGTISDEDALQVQNLIIEGMKTSGIALRGF